LEQNGLSLHRYSKGWLEQQAADGSLFAYHVAFEGIGLLDPDDFISQLKASFRPKKSYIEEARIAALVLRYFTQRDWTGNEEAKRRIFWAIRTVLICATADTGKPLFSSRALERYVGLNGLCSLIDRRSSASSTEINTMGRRILDKFQTLHGDLELEGDALADYLINIGGVARDSIRILGEIEAVENSGLAIYM
jgi:hypothetical protein